MNDFGDNTLIPKIKNKNQVPNKNKITSLHNNRSYDR